MEFKHPKYYAELRKQRRLQALKPTSPQAGPRKQTVHKLRAQASSLSQQAQGSGSPNKDGSAQAPGYKQQGYRNFWDA